MMYFLGTKKHLYHFFAYHEDQEFLTVLAKFQLTK